MAQHGGSRPPQRPAVASGPGALSKRTDGGPQAAVDLPNAAYGEGKEFATAESGAPMAGRMPMPSGPTPSAGGAPTPQTAPPMDVTHFGSPTENPDEPVTAGAPIGPGVGPEAMGLIPMDQQIQGKDLELMKAYLPYLEWVANQPGASAASKAYVRQIKVMMP